MFYVGNQNARKIFWNIDERNELNRIEMILFYDVICDFFFLRFSKSTENESRPVT